MNGLYMADIAKLSFTTYNESDGLLNDHFNVGGAHAMRDGRLLFTSQESFVLFDPKEAKSKEVPGIAYLTDVRLMNRSFSVDSLQRLKVLSLNYDNTSLVLEFSALNFSKLNKLEYFYQLEGFDTAWIRAGDSHQAVYTFLHPGKYVFRIKVRNAEGVFGPVTEYLTIRVSPPFWRAGWFYAFLFICVLLVLYIIDRERIKRLASLYNVRSDIAGQLHEDVSITLNNINVLSQIARKKADKDLVRSKELIDEISGKSYNMMVSMDEILWSIDPNNDTMEKTLLRIAEYARMREAKFGAPIDISVHDKVKDLRLSMKLRHQFFMACKTILQSLASYPGESMIVDIDCVRSRIVLKILHVGTETEDAYQARLALRKAIEEKAGIMQATMGFEVGKKDTSIILSIPVK
jgi:signal transduction histidine kinase